MRDQDNCKNGFQQETKCAIAVNFDEILNLQRITVLNERADIFVAPYFYLIKAFLAVLFPLLGISDFGTHQYMDPLHRVTSDST